MNKEKNDKVKMLADKCQQMRRLIVKMIAEAGSGHPGGSLSCVEIMACLYFAVLNHRPHQPHWPQRDRFHLSKGHACPCWYTALSLSGYFEEKELWTLRKFGSLLQGHPDRRTPGVDVASGSLGQGLSVSIGKDRRGGEKSLLSSGRWRVRRRKCVGGSNGGGPF